MPDKRMHRGPAPEDSNLFSETSLPLLRDATKDLCWLLDRGYADASSLKLVGDRYQLTRRQRIAVMRCCCSMTVAHQRRSHQVAAEQLRGQALWIDGYNVLTTIESALGGGVLLLGRDGCVRDMASMHGTYRKVAETVPSARLIGEYCARNSVAKCFWLLDSPVSNSGRLKSVLRKIADSAGWPWEIELVADPDRNLASSSEIIATADSGVLDRCSRWFNLNGDVLEPIRSQAWIVDLSVPISPQD